MSLRSLLLALALLLAWSSSVLGQTGFFIWDEATGMTTIPGLQALAINDAGTIVCSSGGEAFLWTEQQGPTMLALPQGSTGAYAAVINNLGQVAGTARLTDGTTQLCVWNSTDAPRLIDEPREGLQIGGINDIGQIVGSCRATGSSTVGWVWDPTDGFFSLDAPPGWDSYANAINNYGEIVGAFSNGDPQPVWWNSRYGLSPQGMGQWAEPVDINNHSEAVGYAWAGEACYWDSQHGQHVMDGLLSADNSNLVAVNDSGLAVGVVHYYIHNEAGGALYADPVIWDAVNGARSLGSLLGGRIDAYAIDVNASGVVIGNWWPRNLIPEPSTIAALLAGLCLLPVVRRRR